MLRYRAQTKLIGEEKQVKLLNSKVLIVGLGGLGVPASSYLAGAGIGTIGLCDFDRVSETNLNRQLLYTPKDIGQLKAGVLRDRLAKLNPDINIIINAVKFDNIEGYDFVLDCTDNLETKLRISDMCRGKVPCCHAGVAGMLGQILTVIPTSEGSSLCYRCLCGKTGEGEKRGGSLGPIVGIMGTMQALEVLRYFAGYDPIINCLRIFDGMSGEIHSVIGENCKC